MYVPGEGPRRHPRFSDLPGLLKPGDTLVFNDSRVLPAGSRCNKPSGGRVELLFLHPASHRGVRECSEGGSDACARAGKSAELWEVLARPSHRLRAGGRLLLPGVRSWFSVRFWARGAGWWKRLRACSMVAVMERYGRLPLPPYIKSYAGDPDAYQTVYAARPGSAAAPTAGLHFTPEICWTRSEARGSGQPT